MNPDLSPQQQLRQQCLELAVANLKGAPTNLVIKAADKFQKFIDDGTVPEKESSATG